MEPDIRSYTPSNSRELNLFVGRVLLAFTKHSRELTKNKAEKSKNNLSLRVMMHLSLFPNAFKQNIIDALRSNHTTITRAIKNLKSDGFLIEDVVSEYNTRLNVAHKVTKYRLSLAGECYISQFLNDVILKMKVVD